MRKHILFLTLLVISFNPSSRTIDSIFVHSKFDEAIALQEKFQSKKALTILTEILPDIKSSFGLNSRVTAQAYYYLASTKLDLAQYDEAKMLLDEAITIFKLLNATSIEIGNTYMLLGIYYDYMAEYDKALAYYDLTKKIYLDLLPLTDYKFGYLYNNIGICIYFKGDIERALGFFNKSLAITVESSGIQNKEVSKELNNISFCQTAFNKVKRSKETLKHSLYILEKNNLLETQRGANIFHSLSLAYFKQNEIKIALKLSQKALSIRLKSLPQNHPDIASNYYNMADIYLKDDNTEEAIKYLYKALAIYIELFGNDHPEVASIFINLSKIYLQEGKLNEALEKITNAITILDYDENILNQTTETFNINILSALDTKAKIHIQLWQNNNNILMLKRADKVYNDLIFILNKFRKSFKEELSKEILANDYFHIFDNAIEVSYNLYEATNDIDFLEDAFERYEYSTSFVLLEARRNAKAKKISEIPDSLVQLEQNLKLEITYLEKKKREEKKKDEVRDEELILKITSQIFDKKEKLFTLIQNIESDYPNLSTINTI